MDFLQGTFYFIAILYMLSGLVLTCFIGFLAWRLYQNTKDLPAEIKGQINSLVSSKKVEVVSMLGMFASTLILNKIKNIFRR